MMRLSIKNKFLGPCIENITHTNRSEGEKQILGIECSALAGGEGNTVHRVFLHK